LCRFRMIYSELSPDSCGYSALAVSLGLVFANADDDVLRLLGLVVEVVFEDALRTVGISGLGVEGGAGVMGNHAVSTAEGVLHRAPDVVLGRGLDVPHITGVAGELAAGDRRSDGVLVTDGATGGVDEPCALLEVLQELGVDESASTLVQGAVDGDDVTLGDELLKVIDAAGLDSLGGSSWQRSVVVVEKLLAVEGHETLEDTVANAASTDGADDLVLQVERVAGDLRDLPVAALNHLVGGYEVPDEQEDAHDDVLRDGDDVGAGHLEDLDPVLDSSVQVNVVGADACSDADFEVLGLLNEISGKVTVSLILAHVPKRSKVRAHPGWKGVVIRTSA
jgi:hypothetical protein